MRQEATEESRAIESLKESVSDMLTVREAEGCGSHKKRVVTLTHSRQVITKYGPKATAR